MCRMSDEGLEVATAVAEHFLKAEDSSPVYGIGLLVKKLLAECYRARDGEARLQSALYAVDEFFRTVPESRLATYSHHSSACQRSMKECICHVARIRALVDDMGCVCVLCKGEKL